MKIPLLKNTVTTYLGMFVRLLQGILITRWMIGLLGDANYGLWTMLWSFFVYSLLLDFGLGVAAQKATATELWKRDQRRYNLTISTVFFFHLAMSAVIVAGTIIASCFVRELFHLPPGQDTGYYRLCFLVFGIGSAALFPMGVFPEMLAGLQKLWLCNYIGIAANAAELAGTGVVLLCGGQIISLVAFILVLQLAVKLAMAICACRAIPGFRIMPKWDREVFGEIFNFSGMVYISSIARLAWERGSVLFISIFCGLVPVSIYQVGVRLTVLMSQFTGAYQENVAPLTALLYARQRRRHLSRIILNSMRWNSFLATGMTFGILLCAPQLLRLLFRYTENLDSAVAICRITAVSVWAWLVYRTIPEKYLLMAERHRLLAMASIAEAVIFVALSIGILCVMPSVYVIMWTSIASRLVSTFGFILPATIRDNAIRIRPLLWQTAALPLLALIPAAAAAILAYRCLAGRASDLTLVAVTAAVSASAYLACSYFVIFDSGERRRLARAFHRRANARYTRANARHTIDQGKSP